MMYNTHIAAERELGVPADPRGDTSPDRGLPQAQATARQRGRAHPVQGHGSGGIRAAAHRQEGHAVLRGGRQVRPDGREAGFR